MNKLQTLWMWLDGKKTLSGVFAGLAYLLLLNLGVVDRNQPTEDVILGWLGLGVGHKAVKAGE